MPSTFFGFNSTISHFGERFSDGQYSLVSFLFAVLLLTVPPPVPSHLLKPLQGRRTMFVARTLETVLNKQVRTT